MINNDALSAVLKRERCPVEVCQSRGLRKLSFGRSYFAFARICPGGFCLQMCYCVLQDLQQNRMLVNQNLNSNFGLLVHLREAICSNS